MATPLVFIADDDPLVHFVAKKVLREFVPEQCISSFTNGGQLMEFLTHNANNEIALPDIILLDINMPYMDGITFLNKYGQIKPKLAKQISIYVISSSMNKGEIYKVKNDANVSGFLNKPLNKEILETIFYK